MDTLTTSGTALDIIEASAQAIRAEVVRVDDFTVTVTAFTLWDAVNFMQSILVLDEVKHCDFATPVEHVLDDVTVEVVFINR